MATRARIGLLQDDLSVLSVYHHWDGYPEWLGVTLEEHYNTKEKVSKLIDGGNMSSCYSDNEYDEEKQEFVKNDPRPVYYGGDDERPHHNESFQRFLNDVNACEETHLTTQDNHPNDDRLRQLIHHQLTVQCVILLP